MDTSAHDQLLQAYDEHADAVFRFCYAYTGNRQDAQDVVQDAFVKMHRYLADGNRIEKIRPFVYRTARNIMIDQFRSRRTTSLDAMAEQGFDAVDEHGPDPFISAQAAQAIRMTAGLDEKYRLAVLMRHVDGMTPAEIAEVTGESENNVSVRIHRGLQQLRTLLGIHHD